MRQLIVALPMLAAIVGTGAVAQQYTGREAIEHDRFERW